MVSAMDHGKILILRLSAVGDVIRTLPAVKAIKKHYPFSHITWIVEEPSKTLLESQPEIDEVIVFPRKRWTNGMKSARGLLRTFGEARRFVSDLRKHEFDVAIDFHGILKSGLLGFLSGSHKRIGFDRKSTKEGSFLFCNVRVCLAQERMNRFQRNFALLRALGLEVKTLENIRKGMREPSVVGPRTDSLIQLAEVFRRCNVYVGGDTGPMYLASLVGTPIVVVYGPTDPVLYEPLGLHRKVKKEVGCNPCYPGRKRSCNELTCLKMITVDEVFEATKEILSLSG